MIEWKPIEECPRTNKRRLFAYKNFADKWTVVVGRWFSREEIDECWEEPEDFAPGFYENAFEPDDCPNCWWIEPILYAEIEYPKEIEVQND